MLILRQFPLFATDQAGEESQHGYIMQPYSHLSMDVKINIQLKYTDAPSAGPDGPGCQKRGEERRSVRKKRKCNKI